MTAGKNWQFNLYLKHKTHGIGSSNGNGAHLLDVLLRKEILSNDLICNLVIASRDGHYKCVTKCEVLR